MGTASATGFSRWGRSRCCRSRITWISTAARYSVMDAPYRRACSFSLSRGTKPMVT